MIFEKKNIWEFPLAFKINLNFTDFSKPLRDDNLTLSGDNSDFIKTKTEDTALMYFHNYIANILQQLSNEEFEVLKTLSKTVI